VTVGQSSQALYDFGASSNYNALQVAVNRHASRDLQLGVSYAWSKAMGTTDAHLTNTRGVNYGPLSLDRTQGLTVNYVYDIPSAARPGTFLDNRVARAALSGWEFSGVGSFSVGAPQTPSYTVTGTSALALNRLITGSEDFAPRVVLTCNPNKSRGNRSIFAYIDTSCFGPAAKGSIGNDSGIDSVRGPGLNNWDMSLFRNIQYSEKEQRRIQLRFEVYNVFNHTNWTSVNTTAQFNPTTGALVNAASATNPVGFGALTAVRAAGQPGSPRIIQLAGKLYF
jgi:hypothetical protein